MEDELSAAGQYQVLGNLDAETSKPAQQYGCLRLLRHSFDAHGADVSTPPVLDLLVVNIDFFCIFALFRVFLPFNIDLRNFSCIIQFSIYNCFLNLI